MESEPITVSCGDLAIFFGIYNKNGEAEKYIESVAHEVMDIKQGRTNCRMVEPDDDNEVGYIELPFVEAFVLIKNLNIKVDEEKLKELEQYFVPLD